MTKWSTISVCSSADKALGIFDESLELLKHLSQAIAGAAKPRRLRSRVQPRFELHARQLGVDLELELVGDGIWLAPNQSELLELVVREA